MRHNDGPLEKWLTHMPFTHAFTGSNPVRVTNFIRDSSSHILDGLFSFYWALKVELRAS